jgi:hypothetical protein
VRFHSVNTREYNNTATEQRGGLMIPEVRGATPLDIFKLADAFYTAARDTAPNRKKSTDGPTRLLSYHACELFLKAFLCSRGEDVDKLRAYQHDFCQLLRSAKQQGLLPARKAEAVILQMALKNDYVRVRYLVTETKTELPLDQVLKLTERVRNAVRHALKLKLDGTPMGKSVSTAAIEAAPAQPLPA